MINRWIEYKAVFYSFKKDGNEAAKLEHWLDEKTNNEDQPEINWGNNLVHEYVNDGNCESEDGCGHCGVTPNQITTWRRPTAKFRSDQIEYFFKWAPIREIITLQ